jgi:hypothetical protein
VSGACSAEAKNRRNTYEKGLAQAVGDDVSRQIQDMLHLEPKLLDVLPLFDLLAVIHLEHRLL